MSSQKIDFPASEVPGRILAFRKRLNLNMEDFASKVGVGRIAVLYWESGRSKPSPEAYVRLANVAKELDPSTAVWFLRQAGVSLETLKDLLPEFDKSAKEADQRAREATMREAGRTVAVPLLRETASINAPTLASEDQIEAWFPLPSSLVPHRGHTCCLRAPVGLTVLDGKDIVVVDYSPDALAEQLVGKMVIAECQSTGESFIGFLQQFNSDNRVIPALSAIRLNENFRLNTIQEIGGTNKSGVKRRKTQKKTGIGSLITPGMFLPLTPKPEWKITGQVICWIAYDQEFDVERLTKPDSAASESSS